MEDTSLNSPQNLKKLKDCIELVHNTAHEFELVGTRNTLFGRFSQLTTSHCSGVQVLCENKLPASAFSLLRPLFETSCRGLWVYWCATEDQLERLSSRKEKFNWKSIEKLAKQIDDKVKHSDGALTKIWQLHGNELHGLTHGGVEAISLSYFNPSVISISATTMQLHQIMQLVANILFLNFMTLIYASNRHDLSPKLETLGKMIMDWYQDHLTEQTQQR
ncbi:hypothetical protein [uncultured Pseudoteredinibacter sp.]|uniref:DUF6988 family protein n=1 Tax=uncultured Pseudoteredinibacter sp. TaxID=1641701 RepID=UPI0026034500|nr:hypothetical protein [uncultured Pseudoteredinibacter sp.]